MSTTLQAESVFNSTDINTTINHEPRMNDLRLAQALDFKKSYDIRDLISRHANTLKTFGNLVFRTVRKTPKGGRPGREYWLNKKQCLYLCTKSETPNATDITIQMVEVFDAVNGGELVVQKTAITAHQPSKVQKRLSNRRVFWRAKLAEATAQLAQLGEPVGQSRSSASKKNLAKLPAIASPKSREKLHPAWRDICALFAAYDALKDVKEAAQVRDFLWQKATTRLRGVDTLATASGLIEREDYDDGKAVRE